jgi:hypothetical protein
MKLFAFNGLSQPFGYRSGVAVDVQEVDIRTI